MEMTELEQKAELGDSTAQVKLANFLWNTGSLEDREKAMKYFFAAAEKNNDDALYNL